MTNSNVSHEQCDIVFARCSAVLSQDIPHIFAMTLFEEYIYWTDWETKSINRAHKTLGTNKTTLISTLHRPMDIHIYHPYRQPEGKGTHYCWKHVEMNLQRFKNLIEKGL